MSKTKRMWVVVTSVNIGDQELIADVVLLTPNKKKAERCVEVLQGDEFGSKTNRDALLAKALKAIKGTIPYDTLVAYDSAGCFERTI